MFRRTLTARRLSMSRALHFDRYQFAGRHQQHRPVQVDFIAGELVSTGISHDDYHGMHVQNSGTAERRLPAPTWAFNDSQLRELIVTHLEHRAAIRTKQPGTQAERLARAT